MRARANRVRLWRPPPKRCNARMAGPGAAGDLSGDLENGDGEQNTLIQLRLQHFARAIHRLGPRALYELLAETLERPADNFLERLEAYAALSPDQLRVTGGDRFVPTIFAADGR